MKFAAYAKILKAYVTYSVSTSAHARKTNWTRFYNACQTADVLPWKVQQVYEILQEAFYRIQDLTETENS